MERIEDKHAKVLLDYSLQIKSGDKLYVRGNVTTLPLMRAIHKYAVQMGAFPQLKITDEIVEENLLKNGSKDQVQYIPASDYALVKDFDAALTIIGSENTKCLSNIDPETMKLSTQGRKEYLNIFFDRWNKKEIRCCCTLFPTHSEAQEAGMSHSDYEEFVYRACLLEEEDPVSAWQEVDKKQEKICSVLNTKKKIHILSDGTDLTLSVAGRKWINCCGKVNFPDGEVFTGPVEDSAEGVIRFSFPGIYLSREIEDIQLTFKKGKVVEARAGKGEGFLRNILDTDEGARQVGEIAIGTNYRIKKFTKNMLFDEKIGGTVHLALGRSLPETLGTNESAIHWDMLCDMREGGKIFADDELLYEKGNFLL